RCLRNIKDGNVLISAGKEVINQRRFASANINDGYARRGHCLFYKCKGCFQVQTVPTDGVWRLLPVNLLPMRLYLHSGRSLRLDRLLLIISQLEGGGREFYLVRLERTREAIRSSARSRCARSPVWQTPFEGSAVSCDQEVSSWFLSMDSRLISRASPAREDRASFSMD